MDFGRVSARELNRIDFRLPADPAANAKVLKGKPVRNPNLYVGCAKWGIREWIGTLYPKGTKETQFLDEYVKHYNSIELNATHYKLYSSEEIGKWTAKAKGHPFLFCPKFYKGISHFGSLSDKGPVTDQFLEGILAFEDHLGPIFLQLSDRFGPKRQDELFDFLSALPTDLSFFLEVRHPDWFRPGQSEVLFDRLRKLKIGAVITDTAGRRDCCHMQLTVPRAFIRFVGNSLHPTDYQRLEDWVRRIYTWFENGLHDLFFFMHMHDEAQSPELTNYFLDHA